MPTPRSLAALALVALCVALPAAAAQGVPGLDLPTLLMELLGGLAIFLFGMEQMSGSLKAAAGDRMRAILARLTTNRFSGVLTGALVTAVVQSSSVTTVLVVGFISAGLMSMAQSVGVIMGANVGTTITAQIIAFKVSKYALALIAGGFGVAWLGRKEAIRHQGTAVLGLGLVFFGMGLMGEAMKPLSDYPPFLDLMARMETPLLGILVGAAFTALVQSSSATTGIVIVMAGEGLITLAAGIALIFGSNIGTCVTALLAALGRPREAVRAAWVHVVFNVLGVAVWFAFIEPLAALVIELGGGVPRQIANAHTTFNVANTLLFIGFAGPLGRLVEWAVPDKALEAEAPVRSRYLDSGLLGTPSLALDGARLELMHLSEHVRRMLDGSLDAVIGGDRETLAEIAAIDDRVDSLHQQLVAYLGQIGRTQLSEPQTAEFIQLLQAANLLEQIGDVVETQLVALGRRRLDENLTVSPATRAVLEALHRAVVDSYQAATLAVTQGNEEAVEIVRVKKGEIKAAIQAANEHQATRLLAAEPLREPTYALEVEVVEKLERIANYVARLAACARPAA